MNECSEFWNALAPFHAEVEDSNFDLASVRRLLPEIRSPILIVGAGQGLIVRELREQGYECDGVDLSEGMIREARLRRGMTLIRADARTMPFPNASYNTILYATGVIDFTGEENDIVAILREGRRVIKESGKIFIAFYKASAVQERFLSMVGLLNDGQIAFRQSLEIYLLSITQVVGWVARRAGRGYLHATMAVVRVSLGCSMKEKWKTFRMQRVFRRIGDPRSLINVAPEKLPYRNAGQIEAMFNRLGIPIKQFYTFSSCCVVLI